MTDSTFRGTLLLLQNRTKRDPECYRDEFLSQFEHFKAASATLEDQRVVNPQFVAVLGYVSNVCHCYPKEMQEVANIVSRLLRSSKGYGLPNDLRFSLVQALMLLRSRNAISNKETFPIFFELLQERDKSLRKVLLSHLVSDVRKINMPGSKNGPQMNKKAQNFLFSVMEKDDSVQARCAEMVLIDLYRRRVWCDERTVEVLTQACFSKHTHILRTALRFFLMQMPKISSVDDASDTEEEDPGRAISKLKQKLKIVKSTSKRERVLSRRVKAVKRDYDKKAKEEEDFIKQHVDPIRLLRDPHKFVEQLYSRLHKTSERFEIRILYLNVIARVISEHEVVHLPLYGFLERYMEPSQLHATQLLALTAMCVNRTVPPDAVEPLVKSIANHFVSDRSSPDSITVGINSIREICKRQPLAMNEDLLKDLCEYKNQRGDKGVVMAARALIQLYRDVYPKLLPTKLRGSRSQGGSTAEVKDPVFGEQDIYKDLPGVDLLYKSIGEAEKDDSITSSGSSSSSSSSSSDMSLSGESGDEWVTDSDSELNPDDVEGEFVDVLSEGSENWDECPQLISTKTARDETNASPEQDSPASKKIRLEEKKEKEELGSEAHANKDENDQKSHGMEAKTAEDEDKDNEEEEMEEDEMEEEEGDDDDDDDDDLSSLEDSSLELSEELEEEITSDSEDDSELHEKDASPEDSQSHQNNLWYEDMSTDNPSSLPRSQSRSSVTKEDRSVPISASRFLTDEDFEKLRKLKYQKGSHLSLRGKQKEKEMRQKKRQDLIHTISADLSAHDIENFTEKKREEDKEEKLAKREELRKASSKFEIRKKTKSKLNSTHGEHSKRGKLYQMTKRSQRVATKLKSSVADRADRAKKMKKKDIKFRIKRGWKA